MLVKIKNLTIKSKYHYLWLKYVSGIDLTKHCAKCLLGKYEKRINPNITQYEDVELEPSDYYYLCGVYTYKTNIHLAFKEKPGNVLIIDNDFYSIEINNAEKILFTKDEIDFNLPNSKDKNYNTCRNWWFANYLNKR